MNTKKHSNMPECCLNLGNRERSFERLLVGARWLLAILVTLSWNGNVLGQQIWEYSPYRVQIWLSLDSSLALSSEQHVALKQQLDNRLQASFGPAWSHNIDSAPEDLEPLMSRGLDQITLEDLSQNEFVLVVSKSAADTSSLRVFEAAVERLPSIAITADDRKRFVAEKDKLKLSSKIVEATLEKLSKELASTEELVKSIADNQVSAALVSRSLLPALEQTVRVIPTSLPWQTERIFRDLDKLILVNCAFDGDDYRIQARELDCAMRFWGPAIQRRTKMVDSLINDSLDVIVKAFGPMARVEDAELKSATLRMRAGGLILDDGNPAKIFPGDVLQPIIRRDDRNGLPSLLQALPWTFVAITSSNGIDMGANVYSGISGALQGKANKRTQRVAIRVRPTSTSTELKVVVRSNTKSPQAGCEIYDRNLATEELTFVGRTDWRGVLQVKSLSDSPSILPEAERKRRAAAKKAAEEAAMKAMADAKAAAKSEPKQEGETTAGAATPRETQQASRSTEAPTPANAVDQAPQSAPASGSSDSEPVQLRTPLVLVYVKSGDTVLARLPVVPGLTPLEIAELPSDERRLEAEAFVKGFQGEVLDLIGMRSLLAARIRARINEKKLNEAGELLTQMRSLKNYNDMADSLEAIQRKMLDESKGTIPVNIKSRIDRMIQSTRDTLQKYLQNDLLRQLEMELKKAQDAPPPSAAPATPPAQPAATATPTAST